MALTLSIDAAPRSRTRPISRDRRIVPRRGRPPLRRGRRVPRPPRRARRGPGPRAGDVRRPRSTRDRFDPRYGSARPWLLGIATQGGRQSPARGAPPARALPPRAAAQPDAPHAAPPAALDPDLFDGLTALARRDRDALLLHVWGELSYEETAAALTSPSAPCARASTAPAASSSDHLNGGPHDRPAHRAARRPAAARFDAAPATPASTSWPREAAAAAAAPRCSPRRDRRRGRRRRPHHRRHADHDAPGRAPPRPSCTPRRARRRQARVRLGAGQYFAVRVHQSAARRRPARRSTCATGPRGDKGREVAILDGKKLRDVPLGADARRAGDGRAAATCRVPDRADGAGGAHAREADDVQLRPRNRARPRATTSLATLMVFGAGRRRPTSCAPIFDFLAALPGIRLIGDVTDPLGRPGKAVAVDGDPGHPRGHRHRADRRARHRPAARGRPLPRRRRQRSLAVHDTPRPAS